MKKFYPEVDQEVFIKSRKKKGIVKFINPDAYRTKVTYYDKDDNRKTLWFSNGSLAPWDKNKKKSKQKEKVAELLFGSNLNTHPTYSPYVHGLVTAPPGLVTTPMEIKPFQTSFDQVREFQKTFDLPAPDVPTILTEEQVVNRSAWTVEEIVELLWATAENHDQFGRMFIELLNRMEESFQKLLSKPYEPENKLVNQVDALVDQKYFVDGDFVEMGIIPDPITAIVHAANMAKLHDGVVVRNEVGKVMKPKGWEPPEEKIAVEVERQVKLGADRFKTVINTYN